MSSEKTYTLVCRPFKISETPLCYIKRELIISIDIIIYPKGILLNNFSSDLRFFDVMYNITVDDFEYDPYERGKAY